SGPERCNSNATAIEPRYQESKSGRTYCPEVMSDRHASEHTPESAFVLQLRPSTAQLAGRVEHVVSGRATRFASVEELTVFLTRVLETEALREPAHPIFLHRPTKKD
ncbi:MAG: hypothetical protein AAFZ65_16015, partial [Planctomycetota bacterium]